MSSSCVFIFRRDLRVYDNTALNAAAKWASSVGNVTVIPIFIFNDNQALPKRNKYFSQHAFSFLIKALQDLAQQLKRLGGRLFVFRAVNGDECNVLQSVIGSLHGTVTVAFNADITPYAKERDAKIHAWCEARNIQIIAPTSDTTIMPLGAVTTGKGTTFEVFTPFYRKALKVIAPLPEGLPRNVGWHVQPIHGQMTWSALGRVGIKETVGLVRRAGRHHALWLLENIKRGKCKNYNAHHDVPHRDATTHLSASLKFGCISPREAYKVASDSCGHSSLLVQQLLWREFYYNLAIAYPEMLGGQVRRENLFPKGRFAGIEWNTDAALIHRWKTGTTGVPFVDAAMRCLEQTGWLHNRARMVVAMYLVRDMGVDWRVGERHFATKLVDYDPVNNNQGWCWALSYRRKLNPFRQAARFDPDCHFIKEWVPELHDVPSPDIIAWDTRHEKYTRTVDYRSPIILNSNPKWFKDVSKSS